MYTEVFFDIETKKFFDEIETSNPADLGVSIVSVYKRTLNQDLQEVNGQMFSFWEEDFNKMWPLFSNVDRVIGFNTLKFDILALVPFCPFDLSKLNHFDILDKVKNILGFRLSLDVLATETLGASKIDSGLNAVLYWNEHTPESLAKLKKYCEADVVITRDLYDYGLKNGHLKYRDKWNTRGPIPIDFSYSGNDQSNNQIGLF